MNLNTQNFKYNIPWWMFDIDNKQLITSPWVPSDIKDSKDIMLAEAPIPGLNFQPVSYGGGGNRKLTFTLPLIAKNNTVGNVMMLKQFDNLRNQSVGFLGVFGGQFKPTPRVLFSYGIGSVPMIYWVKKCDPTHKQGWVNQIGMPQYSEIEFELWLDESNVLYKAEEVFRKVSSVLGMVESSVSTFNAQNNKRSY